jgi:hypothetical protein
VSTAQQTLGAQGFFKARSMEMSGRQYDLWYNSGFRNSCVGFTSMNGWVRDARDFRDSECGFGNGPGSGVGPGAVPACAASASKADVASSGVGPEPGNGSGVVTGLLAAAP